MGMVRPFIRLSYKRKVGKDKMIAVINEDKNKRRKNKEKIKVSNT